MSKEAIDPKVVVLDIKGGLLIPCILDVAKRLLKKKEAKIIKEEPFTIQLLRPAGGMKRKIKMVNKIVECLNFISLKDMPRNRDELVKIIKGISSNHYIVFGESDDWWGKSKILAEVKLLSEKDLKVLFFKLREQMIFITDEKRLIKQLNVMLSKSIPEENFYIFQLCEYEHNFYYVIEFQIKEEWYDYEFQGTLKELSEAIVKIWKGK